MKTLALLLLTLGYAGPSYASCVNNPQNEPSATLPALSGKLVYHAYEKYGDGSSQLFLYDFSKGQLTQLSNKTWGISDPMNANISPDGKSIVFMGKQKNTWNVYKWELGSNTTPTNLTNSSGKTKNEDPKYSFDGKSIVYKSNGDIMKMDLKTQKVINLTKDDPKVENAMSYPSVDGNVIYFTKGAYGESGIYQKNLRTGVTCSFSVEPGVSNYYPIVRDEDTVFFTKWLNANVKNDQLYLKKTTPNAKPIELPINDCMANNSDAAPVGSDQVIFSSTTKGNGYELYLGDINTGKRWSLNSLGMNTGAKNKLGAHYYADEAATSKTIVSTLLSKDKPAKASSMGDPALTPNSAFDGNPGTRWGSIEGPEAGTQWISVDLGESRTIKGATLNWDAAAKSYEIQVSDDEDNWTTIYSTTEGHGGVVQLDLSGKGRFVRMKGSEKLTPWGYSLSEFQVWGY